MARLARDDLVGPVLSTIHKMSYLPTFPIFYPWDPEHATGVVL